MFLTQKMSFIRLTKSERKDRDSVGTNTIDEQARVEFGGENGELGKLRREVLILQDELERLQRHPFISGTVLDLGRKSLRVSVDNAQIFEVPLDLKLAKKVKRGSRVILSPSTHAVVDYSEFTSLSGEVTTVDEILDANRIRVQNSGKDHIIFSAVEGLKPGDEVMLDPSKALAIELFARKKTKYALEEIPVSPWDNLGGLEDVIKEIKQEIEDPFKHRKIYERYTRKPIKGILLYGPPGCGKTAIAKSIAYSLSQINKKSKNSSKGYFIKVDGPEILEKWVGNSEANIRRIYSAARDSASETGGPVIVFVDEAEAILRTRGTSNSTEIYDSIVPQFLAEMSGIHEGSNVITILATNREDIIDSAVLRDERIDRRIRIPRPNKLGASEIFKIYLKDKPLQSVIFGFDTLDISKISSSLAETIYDEKNIAYAVVHPKEGVLGKFLYKHLVSGAMIKGIVDRASTYAIQREIHGGERGISQGDLETALNESFMSHSGFVQSLVRDDWKDVFGSQGERYKKACESNYLVLEDLIKPIAGIKC